MREVAKRARRSFMRRWPLLLYPLGVVALYVGLTLDVPGWDAGGFVVNVASSFTTACFGIPTALYIFQGVYRREEERKKKRDAEERVATYFEILKDDAQCLLRSQTKELIKLHSRIVAMIRQIEDLGHTLALRSKVVPTLNRRRPSLDFYKIHELDQSLTTLYAELMSTTVEEQRWSAMQIRWRFLFGQLLPELGSLRTADARRRDNTVPDPVSLLQLNEILEMADPFPRLRAIREESLHRWKCCFGHLSQLTTDSTSGKIRNKIVSPCTLLSRTACRSLASCWNSWRSTSDVSTRT